MQVLALIVLIYFSNGNTAHLSKRRAAASNESLIVGGYPASINDYPFAARLQVLDRHGIANCDGSLLNHHAVLSAGHCLKGAITLVISVGSATFEGGEHYTTSLYSVHHKYDGRTADYDIGVAKTIDSMAYDRKTTLPALLAEADMELPTGTVLTAIGWGRTSENVKGHSAQLNQVKVTVVDHNTCQSFLRNFVKVTERSFCAGYMPGGRGICQGDSGGPAVDWRGIQYGIVSTTVGCGRRSYPAVYTSVAALREWIRIAAGV